MYNNEEIKFAHAFNLINGIGPIKLKIISEIFNGSFKKAWEAPSKELYDRLNLNFAKLILENRNKINVFNEFQKLKDSGISAIFPESDNYPALLKEIYIAPRILYFKGNIESLNAQKSVAIVGTRRASYYGLETAFKLSRDLASYNINIVSGLALGIDAKAHEGCVSVSGKTFAVLGSGLFKIQPLSNIKLSEKIISSGGAIISEYSPYFQAEKWSFPQRNRIIAGLSELTIIVEAPEKSGALITAKFAVDSNRDVGIIPGEINSLLSKGSNRFLKFGACPILSAEDALEILGINNKNNNLDSLVFDNDEVNILENVFSHISNEELLKKTGMDIKKLNEKITMLEIKGVLQSINGGYERINKN